MSYPNRKYRKGYTLFGIDELVTQLERGCWVFYRNKPMHPGFINNMTLQVIRQGIKARLFCFAIDQQKEYLTEKEKKYLTEKEKENANQRT